MLTVAAAVGRWLTRSRLVYGWDTVHYMLAQDRYDIPAHQPHPPGSLFYVLLARAVRLLTHDPHLSLLVISAVFGGALVLVLFGLGREFDGERAGWLAAVIGATAPIFWFFGSLGLNYGPSGTLSALFILLCWRAVRDPSRRAELVLAGGVLAILGGFRPTDQIFLAPAYLWTLHHAWWSRRAAGENETPAVAGSVLSMLVLTIAWLVPNVVSCGGVAGYIQSIRGQEHLIKDSSVFLAGWPAWQEVLLTHRRCFQSTLGLAWLPALLWAVGSLGRWVVGTWKQDRSVGSERPGENIVRMLLSPTSLLAALVFFPAFLFYLLVHFNTPGYALTYAPLVVVLGAAAAARLCSGKGAAAAWRAAGLAVVIGAGNLALSLWGWPGTNHMGLRAMSWAEIRDHDRYYQELNEYLTAHYRPGSVRLLASWNFTDGLRVVEHDLPTYEPDVAQAVGEVPHLPPSFHKLRWLRLLTPDLLLQEGRPILAVTRTPVDLPYYQRLFGDEIELTPIGPGHVLGVIRAEGGQPDRLARSVSDFPSGARIK